MEFSQIRRSRKRFGEAHKFIDGSAVFDEDNLVVRRTGPVAAAEHTPAGLHTKVCVLRKVTSGAAGQLRGLLTTDRRDVRRRRQHRRYRPARARRAASVARRDCGNAAARFSFGHAASARIRAPRHLIALAAQVEVLLVWPSRRSSTSTRCCMPVYGHAKQGASFCTKIAGKQILRKACPAGHDHQHRRLARRSSPGMRLRAGKAGSGKGAGRMVYRPSSPPARPAH